MKHAELIVVKLNTMGNNGNRHVGPIAVTAETDFKAVIQHHFDTILRGIEGYILVLFNGKMYQCERDNVNQKNPYVRHVIKWHPLAIKFGQNKTLLEIQWNPLGEGFTSQSRGPAVVSIEA